MDIPPPDPKNDSAPPAGGDRADLPGGHRASWVSVAGRWAMRPQTAMATVFFVMIGSSALLIRGKGRHAPTAAVVITQQGESLGAVPVASVQAPVSSPAHSGPPGEGGGATQRDWNAATEAFAAGRYDEARWRFDALSSRDPRGILGAARALRQLQGCAAATPGFLQAEVSGRGTAVEWDSRLEAAACFRKAGDIDAATRELSPLLSVPSHRDRARTELESLGPQARARPVGAAK